LGWISIYLYLSSRPTPQSRPTTKPSTNSANYTSITKAPSAPPSKPWALEQFRSHYADPSITKWDIFHYVYAVIHHPEYRHRYAANLRRELPRIPFIGAAHLTDVIPNRREAAVRNLLLQR
jgi:hypothetical protein